MKENTEEKIDFNLDLDEETLEKAEKMKNDLSELDGKEKLIRQIEKLEEDILQKTEELKISEDKFLLEKAEVENFKRRMREEQQTMLKYANQSLIESLLPVVDGFQNAFGTVEVSDANKAFFDGFQMIQTQLSASLESVGLKEVATTGMFNPQIHQAIMTDCVEGLEDDEIIETLMRGYTLHDRTLRAAMVKVNKK